MRYSMASAIFTISPAASRRGKGRSARRASPERARSPMARAGPSRDDGGYKPRRTPERTRPGFCRTERRLANVPIVVRLPNRKVLRSDGSDGRLRYGQVCRTMLCPLMGSCCAARSSTAQTCDRSLNKFIRLGLGAVWRSSVRRHRRAERTGSNWRESRHRQTSVRHICPESPSPDRGATFHELPIANRSPGLAAF